MLFNLGQYFNLFNGLQIAFSLTLAFSVLSFYLLHEAVRRRFKAWAFAGAIVGGVVASFSLLSGLFVWPVGFLQLLVSSVGRRAKVILTAVWSVAGLLVWGAFFYGWSIPERQEGSYFFDSLGLVPVFFLTALGDPLAWWGGTVLSLACGVLLLLLAAVGLFFVYRTGRVGEHSFWLALLAFSTLYLVSLTLGRVGGGIEAATVSRYITFTILAIIGIYGVLAKLFVEGGPRAVAGSLGLLFALVLVGAPFSYAQGIEEFSSYSKVKEREAAILSTYDSRPDRVLDIANRNPGYIKQNAFVLCKLGYTVFSDPGVRAQNCLPPRFSTLSADENNTLYGTDTLAGARLNQQEEPVKIPMSRPSIRVTGWAVDLPNGKPAGGVYLRIDGENFPALYGWRRPDVQNVFKAPFYEFSGFEQAIPTSRIGPGTHELSVLVVTNDRERYYQPIQKITFEVVENRRND